GHEADRRLAQQAEADGSDPRACRSRSAEGVGDMNHPGGDKLRPPRPPKAEEEPITIVLTLQLSPFYLAALYRFSELGGFSLQQHIKQVAANALRSDLIDMKIKHDGAKRNTHMVQAVLADYRNGLSTRKICLRRGITRNGIKKMLANHGF